MSGLGRVNVIVKVVTELLGDGAMRGLEVGVLNGQTTIGLLGALPNLRMWCVDPYAALSQEVYHTNCCREWTQERWDEEYTAVLKRFQPYDGRVMLLRTLSKDAMAEFDDESFDFIFIDANHGYDYVSQDIPGWWPKLRQGGIMFGHDYHYDDVKQAVQEFSDAHKLYITEEEDSVWWARKP